MPFYDRPYYVMVLSVCPSTFAMSALQLEQTWFINIQSLSNLVTMYVTNVQVEFGNQPGHIVNTNVRISKIKDIRSLTKILRNS